MHPRYEANLSMLFTEHPLSVSWPARSAEFRDNVDVTVAIGERLGCRAFNALYGNRIDDVDPRDQDELAVENLAVAGRAAAQIGATVLVEPVSARPVTRCGPRPRRSLSSTGPPRPPGSATSACCATSTTWR